MRSTDKKLLTVAEVAELLGFGVSKTKMLVLQGDIRSVKIGHHRRIPPAAVDEFITRLEVESAV